VIADLLPDPVTAYDTFTDTGDDALFPEERALMANVVDKRRHEFATVRALARTAMAGLGIPPAPLLPYKRGAPQWPGGLVGSMTHCDGYRAAAVARASEVLAVGIDAEPNEPLPEGVLGAVSLPAERRWVADISAVRSDVHWGRLLFSIKETIFKAWYPVTRHELDFPQADITVDAAAGTFAFRLTVGPQGPETQWLTSTEGRWMAGDGVMVTALSVLR
jgi:4'-phosphopantetheinyl transferase EntD